MTADLQTREFLTFAAPADALALSPRRGAASVFHEYGRLAVAEGGIPDDRMAAAPEPEPTLADDLTLTETLGQTAFALRNSPEGEAWGRDRRFQGMSWSGEGADGPGPLHPPGDEITADSQEAPAPAAMAEAEPPLSARLTGRIAVGVVIVSGNQAALRFSQSDQRLVVAQVQNGLSFLAARAPNRDVTFVHEISALTVAAPEVHSGTTYEVFEAPWRDAALQQLGHPAGLNGARRYARSLRQRLGTNWAYVAFFTKYTLRHFAYASLGGPRLVMHFDNDGWGSRQIDRVLAHETGHIFGAPDEYASSNCNCGGAWGVFGHPNSNCAACAPGGGVRCIMQANDWQMCDATLRHLGYTGVVQPAEPAGAAETIA